MKTTIHNLNEFESFVQNFVQGLSLKKQATLITLSGDLGAGKTTFTQLLGKELGVTETINSPTFVIMKRYPLNHPQPLLRTEGSVVFLLAKGEIKRGWSHLIHIDAYRLSSGKELLELDFMEMLKNPKNIIILEWPEKVADIALEPTKKLSLKITGEEEREIEVI